ncbi:hypothetical protein FDP41_006343 [Naegleria fowleri]|uniref:Uncharacterized protein n=1 Tax=Naegleria fowleri TaxID=5763 RepID=A0A6A5BPL8_NAEFO|nr:uncharacterized protein FDP41_006343 [Naegleria fowleri]KAF0974869.1 hypothetical protein FDP41_006343 [Naegleria fowleri]CAG4712011.1 unnamed protein product [Naegleria fowleri]
MSCGDKLRLLKEKLEEPHSCTSSESSNKSKSSFWSVHNVTRYMSDILRLVSVSFETFRNSFISDSASSNSNARAMLENNLTLLIQTKNTEPQNITTACNAAMDEHRRKMMDCFKEAEKFPDRMTRCIDEQSLTNLTNTVSDLKENEKLDELKEEVLKYFDTQASKVYNRAAQLAMGVVILRGVMSLYNSTHSLKEYSEYCNDNIIVYKKILENCEAEIGDIIDEAIQHVDEFDDVIFNKLLLDIGRVNRLLESQMLSIKMDLNRCEQQQTSVLFVGLDATIGALGSLFFSYLNWRNMSQGTKFFNLTAVFVGLGNIVYGQMRAYNSCNKILNDYQRSQREYEKFNEISIQLKEIVSEMQR